MILPLAAPGIFAGSVFIFVNGIGIALLPNILGGPGAVNAGLIATQAIVALDFPLAMAVSAIMISTLFGLLYLGPPPLRPDPRSWSLRQAMNDYANPWGYRLQWALSCCWSCLP